jgi:hypothetical protein
VEFAPYSLLRLPDSGDNRWTNKSIAKLEKELGLALKEQGDSLFAGALTSLSPCSVEAPHDEI